jgi:hypothetical protein
LAIHKKGLMKDVEEKLSNANGNGMEILGIEE